MKFKIDENLPIEVGESLRNEGYDSVTVLNQNLSGTSDTKLATICRKEKRILVTLDNDFANIRTYPPEKFSGIIVLRLKQQDKPHVLKIFSHAIRLFTEEPIERHLWIVEEDKIRIRS
jgi:predicted nuclease of predicted toxin-antitoxin system